MHLPGSDRRVYVPDAQRRVRRSPLLFTAPLLLLLFLMVVLCWEIVRNNMTAAARAQWPWRLELMDMNPLGSLLAVAAGAVFARAQYARAVRPYLGWRSRWTPGDLRGGAVGWQVSIINGGQHNAVIEAVDYRLVRSGQDEGAPEVWTNIASVVEMLNAAGLVVGRDYQIPELGAGFPLVGAGNYEALQIGVFSKKFFQEVSALDIRVRVTDSVGDSHERIINCAKGARTSWTVPTE